MWLLTNSYKFEDYFVFENLYFLSHSTLEAISVFGFVALWKCSTSLVALEVMKGKGLNAFNVSSVKEFNFFITCYLTLTTGHWFHAASVVDVNASGFYSIV